jgi:hypothetical protein
MSQKSATANIFGGTLLSNLSFYNVTIVLNLFLGKSKWSGYEWLCVTIAPLFAGKSKWSGYEWLCA